MAKTSKEKIVELSKDPWHAHVLKVLKEIHGDPLPDLVEHGFVQIAENKNVPQKQIVAWVGNYSHIGEKIELGQGTGSDFSVFWIRLYEILDFLPEYFEVFEPLCMYRPLQISVNKIKSAYSPEELIMIEYQRNCHAHIHQTGYRVKVNYDKNGKLKDNGLFYKGQNKIDLNQTINDELKKYSIDENKMAAAYYKKMSGEIDQLWKDLKKEFFS